MASDTPTTDTIVTETPVSATAPDKTVVEKIADAVAHPVDTVVEAVSKPAPIAAAVAPPLPKAVAKPAVKTIKPKVIKTSKPAVAVAKAVSPKKGIIMEAQIKNAAEKAKTLFTDANVKGTQAFGDVNDFAKGNIEALVESGKIAAKGLETLGQDNAEFARKQFESATVTLKTLSAVKSPTDFFKLQSDYMRTYFDTLVAHSSQNTEKLLKLAGEVAQPMQNRVSVAVEKVKIAA